MQAVFYIDRYFLLPEGYEDFAVFRRAAESAEKPFRVEAVVLREDHGIPNRGIETGVCLAPFFLTGYDDPPAVIEIADPSALYPADVTLLSQTEYNSRLRELVLSFCPGCVRYGKLTDRVQSLNGHFEEICLDGYCAYRVESKPQPRNLRDMLFSFGGFWRQFSYAKRTADRMAETLKDYLYLKVDDAFLIKDGQTRTLTLVVDHPFDALIVQMLSDYVKRVLDRSYLIRRLGSEEYPSAVDANRQNTDSFRKACKRFGAAFLRLDVPEVQVAAVRESLSELTGHWYLYPISGQDGSLWVLVLDVPSVLKALHFRAPFLSAIGAKAELFSQYGVTRGDAWRLASPATAAGQSDSAQEPTEQKPTLAKQFNRMLSDLNKRFFKPHGFKREGQNFRIFLGEGAREQGLIVNFQRSIYGDGNSSRFTINLGLISRVEPDTPIPANFKEYQCPLDCRERLGVLSPSYGRQDKWWELDEETDLDALEAELIHQMETYALPWLGFSDHLE